MLVCPEQGVFGGAVSDGEPGRFPMACKRPGVRVPLAPQVFPGETPFSSPPGQSSRSSDHHLTVVVGGMSGHRAAWLDREWHAGHRRSLAWLNSGGREAGCRWRRLRAGEVAAEGLLAVGAQQSASAVPGRRSRPAEAGCEGPRVRPGGPCSVMIGSGVTSGLVLAFSTALDGPALAARHEPCAWRLCRQGRRHGRMDSMTTVRAGGMTGWLP